MDSRSALLLLICGTLASAFPTSPAEERIQKLTRGADLDGYALGTVHAMVSSTKEHKRLTKRDIEGHIDDPTLVDEDLKFSLHLTSGDNLRMSLRKRSIDSSGARFFENTEDGRREIKDVEVKECFFKAELDDLTGRGFFSLCEGKVMGTVITGNRTYEVYPLPSYSSHVVEKRSADDAARVLVTWKDISGSQNDEWINDGMDIPDNSAIAESRRRRNVDDKTVTVEIGDFLDSFYISSVDSKLDISTNQELINLIIKKWSAAAEILSEKKSMDGWSVTLRLASLEIWRKNPSWYETSPGDGLGERMNAICSATKDMDGFDQVTLHTDLGFDEGDSESDVVDEKRVGLAWIGGVCRSRFRCSAVRAINTSWMTELHEFGHCLGLNHDIKMSQCNNDGDSAGFMGGNRNHYRKCYTDVLTSSFQKNGCLHTIDNTNPAVFES